MFSKLFQESIGILIKKIKIKIKFTYIVKHFEFRSKARTSRPRRKESKVE